MPPSVMERVARAAARVRGEVVSGHPAKAVTARARVEAPTQHSGRVGVFVAPPAKIGTFAAAPTSTGAAIVAIPADPESLAVDGGDPPERLHVTLAYVGKAAELDDDAAMAVHDAAEAASYDLDGGFDATVVGYGVLGSETPPATVLYLQARELLAVHDAAWSELDVYGAEHFPEQHPGFIPHLTLGYGVSLDAAAAWHGRSIHFDYLAVLVADAATVYRIGGDLDEGAPDQARLAVGTFVAPPRYLTVAEARALGDGTLDAADVNLVVRLADGSTVSVDDFVAGDQGVIAAGLCVRAGDTGRVLMLQRSLEDDQDPAAGTWEFPGGHVDEGEDALAAARREFAEEVGCPAPDADPTTHWMSPDGVYIGFVVDVANEAAVDVNLDPATRSVLNPDDPDGDHIEVACWWDPADLPGMPALRQELKDCPGWKDALGLPSDDVTQEVAP